MADEKGIQRLIEQLQSNTTRGEAIGELVKIGEASVPYLIEALKYENPDSDACDRFEPEISRK